MKAAAMSKDCKFISTISGKTTNLLHIALEWIHNGTAVAFWYKGEYVGPLRILGMCDKLSDMNEDEDRYGGVIFCREDKSVHLCIQDELLVSA